MVQLSIVALLFVASVSDAFVVLPKSRLQVLSVVGRKRVESSVRVRVVRLHAAPDEPDNWDTTQDNESPFLAAEQTTKEAVDTVEEKLPKEDLEMVALKQEIADLESALKAKQRQLSHQQDQVLDQYSKAGYARKVAEMETMRRSRSRMNSSSQDTAMASVIQTFLPIFEDLNNLKETYGENDFGKSFGALTGILKSGMKELGVEEFSAGAIGDQVDTSRVIVVEKEYSNVFPKGTVIRPISSGMELQGNVMKMAECVASLGKEEEEEEDSNEQDESENENETESKE